MTVNWKKVRERLSWQTGKLSEIALQAIACGILAILIHTDVIPRSIVAQHDRFLFAFTCLAIGGFVIIALRMIAGGKWS